MCMGKATHQTKGPDGDIKKPPMPNQDTSEAAKLVSACGTIVCNETGAVAAATARESQSFSIIQSSAVLQCWCLWWCVRHVVRWRINV
jgi:hypothetical protein